MKCFSRLLLGSLCCVTVLSQSLTPLESLQGTVTSLGAPAVAAANQIIACEANLEADLDKYGKNKIATGPLSWAMLRAVSVMTPGESWAEQFLSSTTGYAFDGLANGESSAVNRFLRWILWGEISIITGVLWFLVLIFCILPFLWCRCCRKACCFDIDLRQRTHRVCNYITFWICWILGILFTVGLIYWSVWTRFDLHAATCKSLKVGHDLIASGVTRDDHTFMGISLLDTELDTLETLGAAAAAEVNTPPQTTDLLREALGSTWYPVAPLTTGWHLIGMHISTQVEGNGLTIEGFGLDQYSNILVAAPQALERYVRSATDCYSGSSTVPAMINSGTTANVWNIVQTEVAAIRTNLLSGSQLYNAFRDWYNTSLDVLQFVIDQRHHIRWAYPILIICAALPLVGLVAALLLFWQYRKGLSIKDQALSGWTAFAGFMTFGYAFWGIVLFVVGGALLSFTYFQSDTCRLVDEILDDGSFRQYSRLGGLTINQYVIDKCLKRDAEGDLVSQNAITNVAALENAVEIATATQTIAVDFNPYFALAPPTLLPRVVPIVPDSITSPVALDLGLVQRLFCVGLSLADEQYTGTTDPVMGNYFGANARVIAGIQTLMDTMNVYYGATPGCVELCVQPYCQDGQQAIDPTNSRFVSQADFFAVFEATPTTNARMVDTLVVQGTSLYTSMIQCAPTHSNSVANIEFWVSFYVGIYRAAALYEHWTIQENLQEGVPEVKDGPIFFKLIDRNTPLQGSEPTTYSEWVGTFEQDLQAAIDYHTGLASPLPAEVSAQVFRALGARRFLDKFQITSDNLDCKAISLTLEDMKDAVCDSFSGDTASIATLGVWLAVLHFIAFVMCMTYWLSRRRLQDKLKGSDNEVKEEIRPVLIRNGVSEADFLRACEVGDTTVAFRACEQYEANGVLDLNYNNTPLHLAAYYGHKDIVARLCEKGWNPNAANFKRHTPFTACVSNLYLAMDIKKEILTILRDHGALVNVYTGEGDTPLAIVRRAKEPEIEALLLEFTKGDNQPSRTRR